MLFLTDNVAHARQMQGVLGRVDSCRVVALHHALGHAATDAVIVCDANLKNIATRELLRKALAHHRSASKAPVLFLSRDPHDLNFERAYDIGATSVIMVDASSEQIVAAVRALVGTGADDAKSRSSDSKRAVQASVREAKTALAGLMSAARRRAPVPAAALERGTDAVVDAIGQSKVRAWLDVVWTYDDVTYQHCLLVAGLVAAFAFTQGLSPDSQRLLTRAALLHDIGKAHIPQAVLNKAGPLTAAEMRIMRRHPGIGYNILSSQQGIGAPVLAVVRHHHELLDGSGYPDGLSGAQVPQIVRLVTVCDIYAALVEKRPYKAPMPPDRALGVLADMGPKLDAGLVGAFRKVAYDA